MPTSEDIDAVVTWVDGSSKLHRSRISTALRDKRNLTVKHFPSGLRKSRFTDNNEVEFCMRGIRRNLPWIRHIFLVTAGELPAFLDRSTIAELGVKRIEHATIFRGFESALPTFNSISIGTMLHRIPGLASRYIYFNDDVIPVRAAAISDFFDEGRVVVRGRWATMKNLGPVATMLSAVALHALAKVSRKDRSAHLLAQMRAASLAGFRREYIHCAHAPFPVKTNTLKAFFDRHPDVLARNVSHRFRHLDQFVAHPLAHHLELSSGNAAVTQVNDHGTLDFQKAPAVGEAASMLESALLKFVCIQNLEHAVPAQRTALLEALDVATGLSPTKQQRLG